LVTPYLGEQLKRNNSGGKYSPGSEKSMKKANPPIFGHF